MELLDDGEEDLLLAVEVEVEGAARDAGARDDVADAGVPVALAGEDPGRGVEQLLAADRRGSRTVRLRWARAEYETDMSV